MRQRMEEENGNVILSFSHFTSRSIVLFKGRKCKFYL